MKLRLGTRSRLLALFGAALVGLLAKGADASVDIILSLGDLVRGASAIAIVTPESQNAVWEDGRIYTYSQVHVDAPIAGALKAGDEVQVRTLGGVVGKIGQSVEGESVLAPGQTSFLFLGKAQTGAYTVAGRAQGQFPIATDATGAKMLMRSAAVGGLTARRDGSTAAADPAGLDLPARDQLHHLPLEAAKSLVANAWAAVHPAN